MLRSGDLVAMVHLVSSLGLQFCFLSISCCYLFCFTPLLPFAPMVLAPLGSPCCYHPHPSPPYLHQSLPFLFSLLCQTMSFGLQVVVYSRSPFGPLLSFLPYRVSACSLLAMGHTSAYLVFPWTSPPLHGTHVLYVPIYRIHSNNLTVAHI